MSKEKHNLEFTTDYNFDRYDECGQKKLILTQYQWSLLDQLFKYTFNEESTTNNKWMVEELNTFIEKVEDEWLI